MIVNTQKCTCKNTNSAFIDKLVSLLHELELWTILNEPIDYETMMVFFKLYLCVHSFLKKHKYDTQDKKLVKDLMNFVMNNQHYRHAFLTSDNPLQDILNMEWSEMKSIASKAD